MVYTTKGSRDLPVDPQLPRVLDEVHRPYKHRVHSYPRSGSGVTRHTGGPVLVCPTPSLSFSSLFVYSHTYDGLVPRVKV